MVTSYVKRFPLLQLTGVFESAEEAANIVNFKETDALFLDIDMPGLDGIAFRKRVSDVPACIFVTAYPEHALDSFSVETLDFIVKPLTMERFSLAVERLEQFMSVREKAHLYENHIGGDYVYIKEGYEETKVSLHEILYLEGLKDYTLIVTERKKYCVLSSIGNLLKEYSFRQFIRIHRSFAVRKGFVRTRGAGSIVLNNDIVLPVGRGFKENVKLLI